MNGIRTEIRKLATLRLPWVVLTAAVALPGVASAFFMHDFADRMRISVPGLVTGVAQPAWFLVIVVAVLAAASEFQHGTVVTTVLATPRRAQVLAAKAVVAAGFGVAVTALAAASAVAGAVVTATVEDLPLQTGSARELGGALGAIALGGLWAVVASALGLLTRSTALALTAVLLWRFVLEGIAPVVLRNPELDRWMPNGAASAVIGLDGSGRSAAVGAVVVVGYAAALAAVAGASFVRRDPV